jgi:hypothetical protein
MAGSPAFIWNSGPSGSSVFGVAIGTAPQKEEVV